MYSLFDFDRLYPLAERESERYQKASPFPHIVLDDFADRNVLLEALRQYPSPSDLAWYSYDNPLEKKLAMPHLDRLPPVFRDILLEFNSTKFTNFLERLTGIQGLLSDPEFYGGGLHQIERDGKLDIHADFNYHPKTGLDRRLNVILYLNRDWRPEFEGHLELWNAEMTEACHRILPIFNRLVVFNTSDWSFHGHPEPLRCPAGETRKSIALYYYSQGRPEAEVSAPHSTLYQRRPTDSSDPALETLRLERAKGRVRSGTPTSVSQKST